MTPYFSCFLFIYAGRLGRAYNNIHAPVRYWSYRITIRSCALSVNAAAAGRLNGQDASPVDAIINNAIHTCSLHIKTRTATKLSTQNSCLIVTMYSHLDPALQASMRVRSVRVIAVSVLSYHAKTVYPRTLVQGLTFIHAYTVHVTGDIVSFS